MVNEEMTFRLQLVEFSVVDLFSKQSDGLGIVVVIFYFQRNVFAHRTMMLFFVSFVLLVRIVLLI